MCDAIANDSLINVYGGGGHTTLPVGEMFFRAGGFSCINPATTDAAMEAKKNGVKIIAVSSKASVVISIEKAVKER